MNSATSYPAASCVWSQWLKTVRHAAVVLIGMTGWVCGQAPEEPTTAQLLEQFRTAEYFWRQFKVAEQLVARRDPKVLPELVDWLKHEDRHQRGNAAFVFAGLGDNRGFETIRAMLSDRSYRPPGDAQPSSDGRYRVELQIAEDRYYAAHLLGDLKDPRAVPILIPLLKDKEVQNIVPWSLAKIGDRRAIAPLIDTLFDPDPSMRVLAISALEELGAKEALPRLHELLDDQRKCNFDKGITVAAAAKAAIATLEKLP